MQSNRLKEFLKSAITKQRRVLIKGRPGIGKTDVVKLATSELGHDLIFMFPSISDPTDFKGMPWVQAGSSEAHFLPFGDLAKLINAKQPTVCFLDDIGQASPAVQAALMQLILARKVNGSKLSDHVTFVGATNDIKDMAGVSGMIEPLKSRWDTIVEFDVNVDDWSQWALSNGMPVELVAYIRFQPQALSDPKPTKELKNSPSPRTWASVGNWYNDGVQDLEVYSGSVGEGEATKFIGFLGMMKELPSLDAILLDPDTTPVPSKPASLFAVATGLARKASQSNFDRVTRYAARMPKEFEVLCVKDAAHLTPLVLSSRAGVAWCAKNSDVLI